uniref:Thionin-like protein 2 n=2 Tax=Cucumis melo TaxID=3656 RepID=A0A9I9E3I0_CUCME
MKSVILIFIFCLIAGRSIAVIDTSKCYVKCMAKCAIIPIPIVVGACAPRCMVDCFPTSSPLDSSSYFCKVGCVTSRCTKLTTKEDP